MRRLSVLLLPILAAALAACSSTSAAPGWTYAPAPSITPAPSGAASGSPAASGAASAAPSTAPSVAPSTAPSTAPSAGPSTAPSAGGSPAASGAVLTITAPVGAATSGYQPTTLSTAANTPFTIHFDNQDNQAPHNVELKDASGTAVALTGDTPFFQGPGTRDYGVPALPIGTYTYFCVVHPTTMLGTLTTQ